MSTKSRAPLAIGAVVASGVGYYLYTAGGNPGWQRSSDAHRAAAKIESKIPTNYPTHTTHKAEREATRVGQEVGSKIDSAVTSVNRDLSKAKHETEALAKQAKADTLKKIDEFDRTVEEKAAKSKSYLSSWFGSK
ncbi:hypothetical protein B0T21DRAFT_359511 [Apiosordaria backusii]|uniref:Calcofluor white hypersensitive protein n=1 Tax=Apiosordaria backusii TaxID=314023 RepID=A0AA40ETR6_9PEZI|nr:hypothetical protein B0T21DRAFT_359511 [Apiosordaria backusii]